MRKIQNVFASMMIIVAMSACKKEAGIEPISNESPDKGSGAANAKSITMNSSPDDSSSESKNFFLDIDKVDVYAEGSGWITIESEEQSADLNALFSSSTHTLARVHDSVFRQIQKIRLTFGSESFLTLKNGTKASVSIPNKEYVVNIDQTSQAEGTILLNFDLNGSLIKQVVGYTFTPIINYLEDPETGISGHVSGVFQALISIKRGEGSVQTFLDAEGNFRVQDVEPGTYTVEITPFIIGFESLMQQSRTVVVVEGETSFISDITFN